MPTAQYQNKNKNQNQPSQKMGRRSKQTFLQRRHTNGQNYMKRCSTSQIIREMQIKITMRYHFRPVRMAIIKKSTNNKCWRRCGEKGTLLYSWWECKLVQSLWRTVWKFLKKLKLELPYDPAIPLLGICPEKNHNSKRYIYPNVHCSTIYSSQDMEATVTFSQDI